MVMITTTIGNLVVQMSEEAFEAHQAKLARAARRRALRRAVNPLHWLRRWTERQALRRFLADEAGRLGTAQQAIDFALDGDGGAFGDPNAMLGFLEAWREGGDLSDWPAYRPQASQSEVIAP